MRSLEQPYGMSSTTVSASLVLNGRTGTAAALAPFMPHCGTSLALTLRIIGTSSCQGRYSLEPTVRTGSPFWAIGTELISLTVISHCGLA